MVWAVLAGAERQGWPLLAATGGSSTAKTPAMARLVATDARAYPNDRAAHWIRRRSREQGANMHTGEIDAAVLKK